MNEHRPAARGLQSGGRRGRLSLCILSVTAILLAGCAPQPAVRATAVVPGGQFATTVPDTTAAPVVTVTPLAPTGTATPPETPEVDLTQPLSRSQCPVTLLTDYQACAEAFCIRSSATVVRLGERHKILWLPRFPYTRPLVVRARRYGGGPPLQQTAFDSTSPPEPDYPSTWQFPAAGCWRLEADAGGRLGQVTVWVDSGP